MNIIITRLNGLCEQHYRFDNYKRGVADLFIGELGISGKYPYNLLATGAIRMSIERNGDLNPLFAERPVMRHWDFWNTVFSCRC